MRLFVNVIKAQTNRKKAEVSMVPCPNGGRCGSRNHRIGSAAYDRCVQGSTGDAYKSPFVRLTNTPRNAGSGNDITLSGMTKTLKRSGGYVQADSPIFSEVSLNYRQVQDYIDNPQNVSFTDKQESLINEGIQRYIGDIVDDAGIDIDELSPEEIDIACQAAYRAMSKKDALNCVAEKTVRTFSYDCVDNSPNAAKVFDKRGSTYEDGSDEWYSALADAYLDDMTVEYGLYNGRSEADRQAIASALKEAFDESPHYIDFLPGVNVVWSGSLRDVAPSGQSTQSVAIQQPHVVIVDPRGVGPNDEDGSSEKLHILAPHLIFSYQYEGIASDPVQLRGEYVIDLPGRGRRARGFESDTLDDMSRKRMRYFDYPDGVGLDQYAAKSVFRTR